MTARYDDDLPAGWLTRFRQGTVVGVVTVLAAVAVVAVPCFLTWFLPGSSSSNPVSAIKAAAIVTISGNHGGIVVNDTLVTLAPGLSTMLLGWLLVNQARKTDSTSHVVGVVLGYFVGTGVFARWAHLGQTYAPALRSAVAALVFAVVVAGGTRALLVCWPRLSDRYRRIGRAGAIGAIGYLTLGLVVSAGMLLMHTSDAAALQRQVADGASGFAITLLAIGATPNVASAAVGYLTGPGFHVGAHTSVSILSVSHGPLPAFPLVALVPSGKPATVLGVTLAVLALLAVGFGVSSALGRDRPWSQLALDTSAAVGLSAVILVGVSALSSGGLGSGSLRQVGTSLAPVFAGSALCLVLGVAVNVVIARLMPSRVALLGAGSGDGHSRTRATARFGSARLRTARTKWSGGADTARVGSDSDADAVTTGGRKAG